MFRAKRRCADQIGVRDTDHTHHHWRCRLYNLYYGDANDKDLQDCVHYISDSDDYHCVDIIEHDGANRFLKHNNTSDIVVSFDDF